MNINGQSLDSTVTPSITQNIDNQASHSNQQIADSYGSGGAGRGLLNAPNNFDNHLNFGNRAQTDAIRQRYMPEFDRSEKQLSLDNLKGAQMDHLRNLQVATQAASQEVVMNREKALMKDRIEKANRAARGQVLGSVLGIVGGVVGGVYGGPAGAAAGYAGGNAVGNAAGGS